MAKSMTEGKPLKLILQFALPLLAGNIFQQTYNMADAAIVGNYLGTKALASVGASASVQFLVMGFCIGICCGFGIPIAQRFGAKDYNAMHACMFHAGFLTLIVAAILTISCALLCPAILHILSTPDDIYQDSYIYLLILFLGIPFTMLYNLLSGILRSVGDSKTPFMFLVFSTILNILLDLFCIIVLK
ncbi:MAG: MATE family efflux transporter, partial [Lachnospiraceae bacterium]|nr:MATE family efflux transporter [Lachnospiraceae bacterium]